VKRALAPPPPPPPAPLHVEPAGPSVVPAGDDLPEPVPTGALPNGGQPEHVEPDASPPSVLQQVEAPPAPASATLLGLCPPPPTCPRDDTPAVAANSPNAPAVAANSPNAPAVAAMSSVRHAEQQILHTLLALAREIRKPRAYIGYSAFVLMGLHKKARPKAWEGEEPIDLIQTFAPWALAECTRECAVDAVCCVVEAQPGGYAQLFPISEIRPLEMCRHFVACTTILAAVGQVGKSTSEFEELYNRKGVVVLGTVCDGDCGLDVMTQMLSLGQTFEVRKQLRIDISDYLISRIEEPWMHDLMVLCGELPANVLAEFRSGGTEIPNVAAVPHLLLSPTAVAEVETETDGRTELIAVDDLALKAMQWATGLQDEGALLGLINDLPEQIVKEQIALHQSQQTHALVAPAAAAAPSKIIVRPKLVVGQEEVAKAFHLYCTRKRIDFNTSKEKRLPRHTIPNFIQECLAWKTKESMRALAKKVHKWHTTWKASGKVPDVSPQSRAPQQKSAIRKKVRCQRRRREGAGPKHRAALVR
jgi:hypothetical protein